MGFSDFLVGAITNLAAVGVMLVTIFIGATLMSSGQTVLGIATLAVGFVVGLYVGYEQYQQVIAT